MEVHRSYRLGLCLLLLCLQGITEISGATFTCRFNPSSTVTLGTINASLTCDHILNQGETLTYTKWQVKRSSSSPLEEIFQGFSNPPQVLFSSTPAGEEYKNRTTVDTTAARTSMNFPEIRCSDEVTYSVELSYRDTSPRSITSNVAVLVDALAKSPQTLTVSAAGPVAENTPVTFTCAANLGTRPQGSITWELYLEGSSVPEIVTSQAVPGGEVPDPAANCTRVVTSRLTLNVTRRHHQAVVRCQPMRTGQLPNPGYNQTARLDVLFRVLDSDVTVGMIPQRNPFVVGDGVTLTCTAMVNPSPSFSWTRENNANWTSAGSTLTISSLALEDTGLYRCMATNNISGILYNASKSTNLSVVEEPPTTTTPPTTRGPDSTTGKGGVTDASNQPQQDNTGMIIGIVIGCVAFIAIVIIIIVCVVMKRKRNKEIEEPSVKPYNNHQNINSISSQPDLVNDEKKYNYYKDDLSPYIDPKPRSRRPVDLGSSSYDSTTYMPQV